MSDTTDNIVGYLCPNCKWEVWAVWDKDEKIHRCSDCDSEII